MPGFVFAFGHCICCDKPFSFNPVRVPSTSAITGQREPVCGTCIDLINAKRVALGQAAFEIEPDAYGPCDEAEI
jgi:hypothetical protein